MQFNLSEENRLIRQAARDFALAELKPGVIERDEWQKFPAEQVRKLGELGFLGMMVSPDYGGAGMDSVSYALAIEEFSKIDASTGVILSVTNSLVCYGLEKFGNHEQKERFLRPLASGQALGAFCLSEPEAGSDATALRTLAEDQGDHYLLNGVKNWVTNAGTADFFIVVARTPPGMSSKGINAFIVARDTPGLSLGPKENKMGIRGSDTHSVSFADVIVPKDQRIGEPGSGFTFAMTVLEAGRIGIAAQAVGIAGGAYELSVDYAKTRKTFGNLLAAHQSIQFKLADMATTIEAAQLLCLKAAWLKDQGLPFTKASSMAKVFASKTAMDVTVEAVQIHGGYGYVKEYHVERMMRDAKITQIYEGTSEIQKIVIGREVLKG